MENIIWVRSNIFDQLMEDEESHKNWEMLCSIDKPLVPFIGAGISSWCYPMWDDLLKDVVRKNFSEECSRIVVKALQRCRNSKYKPSVEENNGAFRWMEEIAEYIFDDDEDAFNKNKNMFQLKVVAGTQAEISGEQADANRTLENLYRCLGGYGVNTRRAAVKSLYEAFDISRLKTSGKFPEYQNFFARLFPDLLITTNYDKALERCYPSIFSYSYSDLSEINDKGENKKSWLYRAIEEKLAQMQARLQGLDRATGGIAVPDVPMLLKVHGSIEQASNIALSRARYKIVYKGKMPKLFSHICQHSSLIFMGCGLREDRILDELKKQKFIAEENNDHSFQHFALYPEPEAAEKEELNRRLDEYGIYPIFYRKSALPESFRIKEEDYHNNCLGILLENLLRRKLHYHQPLELLWDRSRFAPLEISGSMKSTARIQSINEGSQYIRVEEASQIWELLKSSSECPLIAVTGDTGSGKSTFCQNIQKLNKNPKDAMQFFYISLEDCKTWNEFCIQMYQTLNIASSEIEEKDKWQTVAERVERRCNGYWRSVLIFDHLDELEDEAAYPGQWKAITDMLDYWRGHQIRVIFTMRKYPRGISCHTWHIDVLTGRDAKKVFFSACTSRQYENSSLLEQNTLNALFNGPSFKPASAYLLGRYADSKNDLATLLEEWESCHTLGDSEEQILARLMWNHLLDEHQWADKEDDEKRDIEKNILWIWGILGSYPGIFPRAFFECIWSAERGCQSYQNKELSQKTLIYMKNAGLCEEMIDEKYGFLLENMIKCANKFSSSLDREGVKCRDFDFAKDVNLDGLKSFRGYTMDKYDGNLRSHTIKEWSKKRGEPSGPNKMDAAEAILDILKALGKEVESDEKRKGHKDLNLVLHYEIKAVIRFLLAQLSRADVKKDVGTQMRIAKIGYYFAHYYHYVPSNAFPMVQRLIGVAKKNLGRPGEKDRFVLYELANLYKVMGDIHKLLGTQKGAVECYKTARQLCGDQMLQSFTDPNDRESYQESQRIMASVLLLNDYCRFTTNDETRTAKKLYEQIGDEWGIAYYNQCKGESVFAKRPPDNQNVPFDQFGEVCAFYNAAAEHYGTVEDMTGIAYILKCMGDLLGACRSDYTKNGFQLWKVEKESAVYYQILAQGAYLPGGRKIDGSCENGIYAAACCYAQAFITYCSHINWRGFANVLQGMGNLLRYCLIQKKEGSNVLLPEEFSELEDIFEFSEECYRWLGDMRGLADTLDYAGYGYREKGGAEHEHREKDGAVAEYIALGKWMESEDIWQRQGNSKKASNIAVEINALRKKVNNDRWAEAQQRKQAAEQGGENEQHG